MALTSDIVREVEIYDEYRLLETPCRFKITSFALTTKLDCCGEFRRVRFGLGFQSGALSTLEYEVAA